MEKRYHVAVYHHFENGFDDRFEYSTIREAEKAARGYVSGKMEPDGFCYDGAAVYDQRTNRCVRIFGDYPDERAQAQALGLSRGDKAMNNTARCPYCEGRMELTTEHYYNINGDWWKAF